ncbi:MAG: FG-GAP-like repeat-containing protein [Ardenticatenaceae bacterium]
MSIDHSSSAPLKGAEAKRSWGRVLPFAIVMLLLVVGGRGLVLGYADNQPTTKSGTTMIAGGTGVFMDSGQSLGNSDSVGVALGDVDGDGDLDAIEANWRGQANKVWLNNGAGNFINSQNFGNSWSFGVALGDLDDDDDLDIFIGNDSGQANKVWLNNGSGTFTDSGQNLGSSSSYTVALGDVDSDGDLDAYVVNYRNQADKVWLNNGAGIFTDSGQNLGSSTGVGVDLGDLDADGDLDAFVGNFSSQPDKVWWNNGAGVFSDSGQSLGSSSSVGVALGDVDGDGHLDAFVGNPSTIWLNNGAGIFSNSGQNLGGSYLVALADVDGDNDLDTVGGGQVWLNDSVGNFSNSGQTLGSFASVALGDVDGDHDLDVFVGNRNQPNKVWINQNPPSSLLSVYALAFDNEPTAPANLSPVFGETMDGIVAGSEGHPDKTAVVLVDQDGESDTRIFVVHDGVVTPIVGLPDSDGVLSTSLNEYDMADGDRLGGFLKWARSSYATAETKTTFSYLGHGTFLAPAVDISAVFPETTRLAGSSAMSGGLFPLPYMVRAHPDLTDAHSNALITPHALQVALDVGTNGGSDPIEVLDIVHCFGASVEGFYELSNPSGTPYAKTIIGSPNYTYFAPQMAGQALAALDANDEAAALATTIMTAYEAELEKADLSDGDADVEHPRVLVAVESSKIPAIKERMDEMSWYLMQEFDNQPSATKDKVAAAYGATGTYYDTTYCSPQDWELAAPDALVDSSAFLWQLADQNISTGVTFRALQVANLVDEAVISHIARNGAPWFADPLTPNWTFDGPNASGLALYADLQGQTDGSNRDLSWHARFYTDTTSIEAANDNPHPYLFVQGGFKGRTWADVFDRFWEVKSDDENLTVRTVGCLPEFPPVVRDGELAAERTIFPVQSTLFAGYPAKLGAAIQSADPATNPLVRFKVDVGGVTVFENTISTGYLVAGTHYVEAHEQWTPPTNGLFTLEVTVDPDDRFLEQDESNNQVTMSDAIFSDTPFEMSATTAGQRQWVDSRTVDLELTADEIDILVAQIHEYVPGTDPNTQVPIMTHQLYLNSPSLPNFSLELPAEVEPGPITVHLWGIADGKLSQEVAIVEFNYAPATRALGTGTDYFLFEASAGDNMQISANVTAGEANMYIWEPGNLWTAQMVNVTTGNSDSIVFNPARAGEYIVMVEGTAAGTQYTISSQRNEQPGRALAPSANRSSPSQLMVQKRKPTLLAPVPQTPEIWQPEPLPTLYLPIVSRN